MAIRLKNVLHLTHDSINISARNHLVIENNKSLILETDFHCVFLYYPEIDAQNLFKPEILVLIQSKLFDLLLIKLPPQSAFFSVISRFNRAGVMNSLPSRECKISKNCRSQAILTRSTQ